MRYALGFLKPDCIKRNLEEIVYRIIETSGLRVVFKRRMSLDITMAEKLYSEWKDRSFYGPLCRYMVSGPIEVFIVEGDNAIERLQELVGECGSVIASSNTIRGRFAISDRENVIHSTTNEKTFRREAELLLGEEAKKWIKL